MPPDYWGESQEWLTKLWLKICSLFLLSNLSSPCPLYSSPSIISTLPKSPPPHSPSLPLPAVWPKLRLDLHQDHRNLKKINPIVSESFSQFAHSFPREDSQTGLYIYPPLTLVLHLYTLLHLSISWCGCVCAFVIIRYTLSLFTRLCKHRSWGPPN